MAKASWITSGYARRVKSQNVAYGYVLMDSWYAVTELMVHIDDLGKIYYCPLKDNRLVDDTGNPNGGKKAYKPVSQLEWDQVTLDQVRSSKLKVSQDLWK